MGEYTSSITIEERIDDRSGRTLILVGAGLPFQGVDWPGKLSMKTTWNAGNPRATQQVFGPQELPSQWSGMWSRTLLDGSCKLIDAGGSITSVAVPFVLRDAIEDFFRSGHLLRVTWSTQGESAEENSDTTREGRAETWSFPHERLQDISWSVTWNWVGRDDKQALTNVQDSSTAASATDVSAAISDAIAKAASLNPRNSAPSSLTLGQLDALANYPTNLVNSFERQLRTINNQLNQAQALISKVRGLPASLVRSLTSVAQRAVATANTFVDLVERVPLELFSSLENPIGNAVISRGVLTLSDATTIASRRAQAMADKYAQGAAQAAAGAALTARQKSTQDDGAIVAVHVVRAGDTPERISMRYYANADRSIDIMRANRLPLYQTVFDVGSILIIPRLSTSLAAG